jgi:hypothetical protein
MASTTLNVGNAIGLAVLIAIANAGVGHSPANQLPDAIAHGGQIAVLIAAAAMAVGMLASRTLPRRLG